MIYLLMTRSGHWDAEEFKPSEIDDAAGADIAEGVEAAVEWSAGGRRREGRP